MTTTDELRGLFCDLTVAARCSAPDLIAYSDAIYYHHDAIGDHMVQMRVRDMREALDKLDAALRAVEAALTAALPADTEAA